MKARSSPTTTAPLVGDGEDAPQPAAESDREAHVKLTPLLIVLGVVALLAGLASGILMSQATFLR